MKYILLAVFVSGCVSIGCKRHETASEIESPTSVIATAEHAPAKLVGKWLRPDGGYVLEIRAATAGGKLEAGYFNPNPINVSQATWRRSEDGGLFLFVELRDQGYPGATYKLIYKSEDDKLTGAYHQPTHGETFAVEFVRQ